MSVSNQDIPTELWLVDNGSNDQTRDWILRNDHRFILFDHNTGVSFGWNTALNLIFKTYNHCLVVGNDTQLPFWTYRVLKSYGLPFVTGVAVGDLGQVGHEPEPTEPTENPDFSCFYLTRDVWQKIGPFNEEMVNYCSDCDMHVRAHRMGIPLFKVNCPYFHVSSQTIARALPHEKDELNQRANLDREAFRKIYGCIPGQPEYAKLFE
jgi:GT2 family glycosyltransferase